MEKSPTAPPGLIDNFSYLPGKNFPSDVEEIPRNSANPTSPYRLSGIQEMDKAIIIETAIAAMDELLELLRMKDPVWINSPTDGRYMLHRDSYDKLFPKPNHFKSASARMESSKDSGEVAMAATQLVEMFLDPVRINSPFPTYDQILFSALM